MATPPENPMPPRSEPDYEHVAREALRGPMIPDAAKHPWELGCRTCQREAEARVAELEDALRVLMCKRYWMEGPRLRVIRAALKGESLD